MLFRSGDDASTCDWPLAYVGLVIQIANEDCAHVELQVVVGEGSFCEDQDVLIIESCKLISCLQGLSNNIEQIANSRALNIFPLINWSGKAHHVIIIIGGRTDADKRCA